MESVQINGITIYYDLDEAEAAKIIRTACQQSIRTIKDLWELQEPNDCRVYVLNSWPGCVFQGAPLYTQILLVLTTPLWYSRFKKLWEYAGGWTQNYGPRIIVGVKSPHLIDLTTQPIGKNIFITEPIIEDKVLSIVSHELTHAFSSHLGLPTWLHEGIAMISADHALGRPTVIPDTLNMLRDTNQLHRSNQEINLQAQSQEDITLLYVRGYWITKYLMVTQPNLIITLLKERASHEEIDEKIAETVGQTTDQFWTEIDHTVANHFSQEMT